MSRLDPATVTLADIRPDHMYSATIAGAVFGHSKEWARSRAAAGWFAGAYQLDGDSVWLIPGEAIRARHGEKRRAPLPWDYAAGALPPEPVKVEEPAAGRAEVEGAT